MSREFPISSEEEGFVTRREFTKFLGLTSLAFLAGTFIATGRKLWKRMMAEQAAWMEVAAEKDIPVGEYRLFRYPTKEDPCILMRLDDQKFTAFNQHCTHLACP